MRRLITYLGLDGRRHELNTGRCECLPVSSERDAYGCLIEETLYTYTAPDGKKLRVRHTYWEAPDHEVDYWEGIWPINETAREIREEEYDRIRPDIGESCPEPARTSASRSNEARNAWLVERWQAGETLKQIREALVRDHPEWARLDVAGVHVNIQRHAKKHKIPLLERKQKRKPDLRPFNKNSAEGC
jgi:hypothetical protein